jgi:farnesyl-diphosphate farnesyltransferase
VSHGQLAPALLDSLLEKTSRTFALSTPMLPEPTRREVTVAYLLFRVADTLEDSTLWPRELRRAELASLGRLLREPSREAACELARRWTENPPCEHEGYRELLRELPALLEAYVALSSPAHRLVRRHTLRTAEGMASVLDREEEAAPEPRDLDDLRAYCYIVAGLVGEMLTELFLLGRPSLEPTAAFLRSHAATFGEALQLVNILKDAATDEREGRCYLPPACDRGEVFALARRDLEVAGQYVIRLERYGAPRGLLSFTASPVLLAWASLEAVERSGPGAKISRAQVAKIMSLLDNALSLGSLAELLERQSRPDRPRKGRP